MMRTCRFGARIGVVDTGSLQAELKELHRGRGIRRTRVRSWLGPHLQEILGIGASTSDEDARIALVTLLREHTTRFPSDLRYLFMVASGIAVDGPFLDDRLEIAARELDRGQRVLRRRLRTAEELLADSLNQAHPRGAGPFDDQGWQWDSHDFRLVLRGDAQLTMTRTLRALADHQKFIHESFSIPGELGPRAGLTFDALAGVALVDVERSSPNSWRVTLALPPSLPRGQVLSTKLLVTVPQARALHPFLALAPLRPSRRMHMTVDFGTPPAARECWLINGAIPTDVAAHVPSPDLVDPQLTPIVSCGFPEPRPGLAYGIGWTWAD
jgi:hypothetical protein